jgi:hypothetical protein
MQETNPLGRTQDAPPGSRGIITLQVGALRKSSDERYLARF